MKSKRSRLLALCGMGLLLTLAALGYIRFYISRPVGSGPAGPVVARESFDKPWSDRQVLLLGIGDSVTAGLGAKNANHSYFQRLAIHAEYNQVIHRCAEAREQVHLVPMYRTFLGHGGHCCQFWRPFYDSSDPHYWFYDNVEDPNDRGYDAIRRIFINSIIAHSALNPTRTASD